MIIPKVTWMGTVLGWPPCDEDSAKPIGKERKCCQVCGGLVSREMTQNAMSRSGKAASQGVSSQVCQQGLLLDASELGLLIWALSALSVRHNKIYSCIEKPIKAFVS